MQATAAYGASVRHWRRSALAVRATTPFELLIVGSWAALAVWTLTAGSPMGGRLDMSGMPGMSSGMVMGSQPSAVHAAIDGLPMWLLMSVAMMLPAALPALMYVASHSLRRRRRRAMIQFALVYLSLWVIFGAAALALAGTARVQAGAALGVALAIGAAWQLTPFKRRAIGDCHRSLPVAPSGRAASVGVARFGAVNGTACVRSCWPSMLAMAVVPGAQMLLWMPVLTALVVVETTAQRPLRAARMSAAALAVGALTAFAVG